MPIDKLDGVFVVKTRDRVRDDYLRDFKSRVPTAKTDPKSQLYVEAQGFADALMPLYFDASLVADATSRFSSQGEDLDKEGEERGLARRGKTGASGYVVGTIASGGAFIPADSELRYVPQGLRFRVLVSATYFNGGLIPVVGITDGPATNLAAGTKLTWLNPPAGVGPTALVFENGDGSGLTGGANAQTDEEYRAALFELEANPPQSGNDAEIAAAVLGIPGLAVERAFVYPAILGPGTTGVAFTMRPAKLGASRLPNGAQIALVNATLTDAFPGDDGILVATLGPSAVNVAIEVAWGPGTTSWIDAVPWPAYASPKASVAASPAPTAIAFDIDDCATAPMPGKTIALFDQTTKTFKRKRIATATFVSGSTYSITVDTTTTGASDTSFVPAAGAAVSPWSDSLDLLVEPMLTYFGKQGPGEMLATFNDPGRRQRRWPAPTANTWPSAVENRLVEGLFSIVSDAVLLEPAAPSQAPVGIPGTLAYLHELADFAVYPQ